MLNIIGTNNVYLACGSTDIRKSIDGLAAIVQISFSLDPLSSCLFAFCSKNRDKIKILQWERNGFWLYYKRLEKGKFQWPADNCNETIKIGVRELGWLLEGLSLNQKQAHRELTSNTII